MMNSSNDDCDPQSDSEAPQRVEEINHSAEDDTYPEVMSEFWTATPGGRYGELPDPRPRRFHGPRLNFPIDDPSKTTMSPLWWFSKWWSKDMTDLCSRQTNLYAAQAAAARSDEGSSARA